MMATVPTAGINLRDLLRSGQFSDLTVVCGNTEFQLHKVIACLQSPVLLAEVNSDFEEGRTGVIKIDQDQFDAETVRRFVEFLYTGDYEYDDQPQEQFQGFKNPDQDTPSTVLHVRVNAIADYYGVKALGQLANQKLEQAFNDKWDPKAFMITAKEALNASGDKSLHDSMAWIAAQNMKDLVGSRELAKLVGDFAAEVMRHQVKKQAELIAKREYAEAETARVKAGFGEVIASINDGEYCRNSACQEAAFGCNIEQIQKGVGEHTTYVLRCSYCRCRH